MIVLGAANYTIYRSIATPPPTKAYVFSDGKGTAFLVRTPSGKTILIDTGSNASILRSLGENLPMWQRSLDTIILTGDKTTETGGLQYIRERYHIGSVISTGGRDHPYGAPLSLARTSIIILAPGIVRVSSDASTVLVSSTSPVGIYHL